MILFFTLRYVYNIETKKCAEITDLWEFKYIKYYAILFIIFILLFFIFYPISLIFLHKNIVLYTLPLVFSLVFVLSIFKFLKKTKGNECTDSWEKKLLKIYGIIYVITLTLAIISLIILNILNIRK